VTSTWAVVVAAGRGDRLGLDRPKAFAKLNGRPLLAESLERLEASEWVEAIVLVAPPEWEEPSILVAEEIGAGKVTACVPGGGTRAESVLAGVAEVEPDALVVIVPLGEGWDGAVPAMPVADTLKRAGEDGSVVETVDRTGLLAVQTPQAFLAPVLRDALRGELGDASDCAALVERRGGRVLIVEGDRRLVKVTTQADLAFVETLLDE
jgi:2-C-methyl-D-erythritol 4-phosphate cytidylyltransferase